MNQQGFAAILIVTVIMTTAALISMSVVFVFLNQINATKAIASSYESFYAAESGIEDLLLRYMDTSRQLPSFYPSIFTVGGTTASSTFSEDFFGNATIVSEGDRFGSERRLEVKARLSGPGTFSAAAQVGVDGIVMHSNSAIKGNVFTNGNITGDSNTEIEGDAVAVGAISSPDPDVTGTKTEGAAPVALPYIDTDYWKTQANINSDPIIGDVTYSSGSQVLGPRKIDGNLTLDGGAKLTLTGPLHITGNFLMNSNSDLYIDENLTASTTVVIVDGTIEFNSNAEVHKTTGVPHGYILLLSMYTNGAIIDNSNSVIEGALYAPNGQIEFNSNADIIAFAAKGVVLGSNAIVDYDMGLRTADFTGGPSAGPAVISWEEK